jgi:hypothetical protein
MVEPFLAPCLVQLRSEFDYESPNRSRESDGWIADGAHSSTSDHQARKKRTGIIPIGAVLAIDVTSKGIWPTGYNFDWYIQNLVRKEKEQGPNCRLQYVIWNHHIAEFDRGWVWHVYTGTSDPHVNHAHVSARHDGHRFNDESEFGVNDMNEKDKTEILEAIKKAGFAWDDVFGRSVKVKAGEMLSRIWSDTQSTLNGVNDVEEKVDDVNARLKRLEEIFAHAETPAEVPVSGVETADAGE